MQTFFRQNDVDILAQFLDEDVPSLFLLPMDLIDWRVDPNNHDILQPLLFEQSGLLPDFIRVKGPDEGAVYLETTRDDRGVPIYNCRSQRAYRDMESTGSWLSGRHTPGQGRREVDKRRRVRGDVAAGQPHHTNLLQSRRISFNDGVDEVLGASVSCMYFSYIRWAMLTVVPIIKEETRSGTSCTFPSNALIAFSMPTVTSAPVAALCEATTASAPVKEQFRSAASVFVPATAD